MLGPIAGLKCFKCVSPASMLPSSGVTGLSNMLTQVFVLWSEWMPPAKYVRGSDYTPRWPVGPTGRPEWPALWGLSSPGRLELGEEPGSRLTASSCPAQSVICTCQWETVLTHQIMGERKLLQGGDALGWQYGDVKYVLGGGEGDLEEAQITCSTNIPIHTHIR